MKSIRYHLRGIELFHSLNAGLRPRGAQSLICGSLVVPCALAWCLTAATVAKACRRVVLARLPHAQHAALACSDRGPHDAVHPGPVVPFAHQPSVPVLNKNWYAFNCKGCYKIYRYCAYTMI